VPAKFAWHEKWQIICLDLNGKDRLSYEDTTEKKLAAKVLFNSILNEMKIKKRIIKKFKCFAEGRT
jgi:hypothetical protein